MNRLKTDHREARVFILTEQALRILGEDLVYLGLNLYQVKDLNLLCAWWRRLAPAEMIDRGSHEVKRMGQSSIEQLSSALWIHINQIHPKHTLRFSDLR